MARNKIARVGDGEGELAYYTMRAGRHYVTTIVPAYEPNCGQSRTHEVASRDEALEELPQIEETSAGVITAGPHAGEAADVSVWYDGPRI